MACEMVKLYDEDQEETLQAAMNYAASLLTLRRFEEARSVLRKTIPVARRALGKCNEITLGIRINYARALFVDDAAALDDLREAVATLEETERIARRVLGDTHPTASTIALNLRSSRAALRARETPSSEA